MQNEIGQRVIDLSGILASFEAQEGEVQQIIGQTGQGKTYEATRRALNFLYSGYVVYTTWRLNIPDYYDEREHIWPVIRNALLFRKEFYRFNFKENWKYVNLDDYNYPEGHKDAGVFNTEAFAVFLASRTDCIFMLDEGQDTFDSHQRAGKIARQSITRTRHMHKTLIIISQRAQAVDVNARGNVTHFYKCEKRQFPFLPAYFKVYRTEDIDENNNHPIWIRHNSVGDTVWKAPVFYSAFARRRIYGAYDSWYMRKQMVRSQSLHIEAFELSPFDKFRALARNMFGRTPQLVPAEAFSEQQTEVQADEPIVTEVNTLKDPRLGLASEGESVKEVIHSSDEAIHSFKVPLHKALPIHDRVVEYVPGTLDLRKIQVRT